MTLVIPGKKKIAGRYGGHGARSYCGAEAYTGHRNCQTQGDVSCLAVFCCMDIFSMSSPVADDVPVSAPAFEDPFKRLARGPLAIGAVSGLVSRPILGKRGLAEGDLLANWETIVGDAVARQTMPEHLRFPRGARHNGELLVRVASGPVALHLEHSRLLILDRINRYFGYQAVARIKIIQAPLPVPLRPSRVPPSRPLSVREEADLTCILDGISDPQLKATLERLGRGIMGKSRKS